MKGNALFLSAAVMTALTGCSTTPESAPESFSVNPVHLERCYSMDNVNRETAGRAYLAEGRQFYFHVDCERHLALQEVAESIAAQDSEPVVSEVQSSSSTGLGAEGGLAVDANAESAVTAGKTKAFKATIEPDLSANADGSKAEDEPTCYSDKMTAGRGDLPPCEWDEEKQEHIKK